MSAFLGHRPRFGQIDCCQHAAREISQIFLSTYLRMRLQRKIAPNRVLFDTSLFRNKIL